MFVPLKLRYFVVPQRVEVFVRDFLKRFAALREKPRLEVHAVHTVRDFLANWLNKKPEILADENFAKDDNRVIGKQFLLF